jgi:hypothetical protein
MIKSKREQELETEIKKLKKEIETLKKTLKLKNKQMKQKDEQLEDLSKENKTIYYKNKYELEKEENQKLRKQLQEKEDYIVNIRGQLQKNSTNSSKPSSTNIYIKPICNSREKTNRKQGGQTGHAYHESQLVETPTKTKKLRKQRTCECGGKIEYDKEIIRRQIIDLLTQYSVIEYQGQNGKCSKCGKIYKPQFPKEINNRVNYGNSTKVFSMILGDYGNIAVDKIQEIIGFLTNSKGPVGGTIMKWKKECYKKMKPIREDIKNEMIEKEPIINNDETPYRENGKLQYAIGAFTDKYSVIECNGGRDKTAFDEMGIFTKYVGTIMGDHYALNESFNGQTAFCNAHTIRTAKSVLEVRKESMAKQYIEFMYKIKAEVDKSKNNKLSEERYKEVRKDYIELLEKWKKEFNKFMEGKNTKYYDDERKLINLLLEYVDGHLLFAKEDFVMFTNNLAEQGLRPLKTKTKVIGGFRNKFYADGYTSSLSIIQTARKLGLNPCDILKKIMSGQRNVFAFQNS